MDSSRQEIMLTEGEAAAIAQISTTIEALIQQRTGMITMLGASREITNSTLDVRGNLLIVVPNKGGTK